MKEFLVPFGGKRCRKGNIREGNPHYRKIERSLSCKKGVRKRQPQILKFGRKGNASRRGEDFEKKGPYLGRLLEGQPQFFVGKETVQKKGENRLLVNNKRGRRSPSRFMFFNEGEASKRVALAEKEFYQRGHSRGKRKDRRSLP